MFFVLSVIPSSFCSFVGLFVTCSFVPYIAGSAAGVLSRTRKASQRLNELAVWGYFTQICDALLHMHGQRIMHRDLKPANVLVCRDGTVKLGDLGLGR